MNIYSARLLSSVLSDNEKYFILKIHLRGRTITLRDYAKVYTSDYVDLSLPVYYKRVDGLYYPRLCYMKEVDD